MARRAAYDPFQDVKRAQDYAREGVTAYGEQLRPEFERQVGATLGGLNEIGALRSGGTQVALRDLSGEYGERVGTFARGATLEAIGTGLQASRARLEERRLRSEEAEARARRKGALLGAIGSVLGAGVGFIASGGNPAGAYAGAKVGGTVIGGGGGRSV